MSMFWYYVQMVTKVYGTLEPLKANKIKRMFGKMWHFSSFIKKNKKQKTKQNKKKKKKNQSDS